MNKTTPNRTFSASGVGGALGVIVVIMAPKIWDVTWDVEDATMMTAALGALFAWLVRYLPQPKPKTE